jgi:hypothetical protein
MACRLNLIVLLLGSAAASGVSAGLDATPIDTARYLATVSVVMAIGYLGLLNLMGIMEVQSDAATVARSKGDL